jgi:hypothetical protein
LSTGALGIGRSSERTLSPMRLLRKRALFARQRLWRSLSRWRHTAMHTQHQKKAWRAR